MPRASPAVTGLAPLSRQSRAKPRHMNATMGTSVPPTHSSNAIIGDAAISRAQRAQSLAPAIRSAEANTMRNTTPNHTRGSVSSAVAEQRLGHAERGHQRQVRVVLVGVGGGGQHLRRSCTGFPA